MNLLTLDLAASIGWSSGPLPDPAFTYGTARLKPDGTNLGAYLASYADWLHDKIDTDSVSYIVFEAPVMPRFTSITTLRQLYGLTGLTELIAHSRQIKCREANISSIRKMVCGTGQRKKVDVVRLIKLSGYAVQTDDEADAIAVRLYVIGKEHPELMKKFRLDLGPIGMQSGSARAIPRSP